MKIIGREITERNFDNTKYGELVSTMNKKHSYHVVKGDIMITVKFNIVTNICNKNDIVKFKLFNNIYDTAGNRLNIYFQNKGENIHNEKLFYKY